MRITITGASGLIGSRADERARTSAATRSPRSRCARETDAHRRSWTAGDAVVHLAGENVAQRWTDEAEAADPRVPRAGHPPARRRRSRPARAAKALISASAVGYYGPHGDEQLDEDAPPGDDFLAQVCVAWEREAAAAEQAARRARPNRRRARPERRRAREDAAAVQARRGRPGGRRQAVHAVDPHRRRRRDLPRRARRHRLAAARSTPPRRSRSRTRSSARRSGAPCTAPRSRRSRASRSSSLYGDMAMIVTEGQRAVPRRTLELGYTFRHPELDEALRAAVCRSARGALARRVVCRGRTAPICFHLDSGLAGTNSQMSGPRADRTRPDARPGFSP